MNQPYGIIYLAINIQNRKVYVGQTTRSLDKRIEQHYYDMLNPKRKHFTLYKAFRKYGINNFKWKILGVCYSKKELDIAEKQCIAFFESNNQIYGYNNSVGGTGGPIRKGMKTSKDVCEKISESCRGRVISEEQKLSISNTLKGRKLPEETKKKMSESRRGRKAWNKGKKLSDEHKRKMSESRKGRQPTKGKHWKWNKKKKEEA